MKRLFQNGVPLASVCAVGVCLAAGVAAAYTAILVAVMAASVLFCNPFGLLDVALATKARRCMGAGIVLFLLAFVQPFGWQVSVFLVLVGFLVLYFGLRFNRRLFKEQMLPMNRMRLDVMHSPYVDQAIAQMNADPKNLGAARQYWKDNGIRQYRAMSHLRGISVTEEEIARVAEAAFCLGWSTIRKYNHSRQELRGEIDRLKEELAEQKRKTADAEERCSQAKLEWAEERRRAEQESYRADRSDREVLELSAIAEKNEADNLTGEDILDLLASGLTQRDIAAQYGLSPATINRRKKAAEAERKEQERIVAWFNGNR